MHALWVSPINASGFSHTLQHIQLSSQADPCRRSWDPKAVLLVTPLLPPVYRPILSAPTQEARRRDQPRTRSNRSGSASCPPIRESNHRPSTPIGQLDHGNGPLCPSGAHVQASLSKERESSMFLIAYIPGAVFSHRTRPPAALPPAYCPTLASLRYATSRRRKGLGP